MKLGKLLGIGCAMLLCASGVQAATPAKEIFGHIANPTGGSPQIFGSYAKGCIAGAQALPETGPTWQAMRLSRNRNYGHPELVDYLVKLSQAARSQAGWAGLYIGDMGQPRGGPMLTGHASHQIGLDADIWMLPPSRLNLSRQERENISSISVVTSDYMHINSNWTVGHFKVLRAAASDPRTARIFVTPAVKLAMCQMEKGDRGYLHKIRPWWGHNYHFHVRLKCPAGSPGCQNQTPVDASNDGCAWAQDFYDMYVAKTKPVPPSTGGGGKKPPLTLATLPPQCSQIAQ